MDINTLPPKETFLKCLDIDPIVDETFMTTYDGMCNTYDGRALMKKIVSKLESHHFEERLSVVWGQPGFRPRSCKLKFMPSDYYSCVSGAPGEDPRKIDICILYHELVHVYQALINEPIVKRDDNFKNSWEYHAIRGRGGVYAGENPVRRGLGLKHRLVYTIDSKDKEELLSKSVATDHPLVRNKYFSHMLLAADFTKDQLVKFYRDNKVDLPVEKVEKLMNAKPPHLNLAEAFIELGLIPTNKK